MISLLAILAFLVIVASTWWFGLWSNLITLVNFLLAALLASSLYETVAAALAPNLRTYSDLLEFVSVWLVFVLSFVIFRGITSMLSKRDMRFDTVTEMIGRSLLSLWIGFVFIQFALFTLHMAPLPPEKYSPDIAQPTLGFGPDRMWLALVQSRSRGALSTSKNSSLFGSYNLDTHPDDTDLNARVFDPKAEFLFKYRQQREAIASRKTLRK